MATAVIALVDKFIHEMKNMKLMFVSIMIISEDQNIKCSEKKKILQNFCCMVLCYEISLCIVTSKL